MTSSLIVALLSVLVLGCWSMDPFEGFGVDTSWIDSSSSNEDSGIGDGDSESKSVLDLGFDDESMFMPGACYDLNSNCAYWAQQNYCNSAQYSAFMSTNCEKSCGTCSNLPPVTTTVPPIPSPCKGIYCDVPQCRSDEVMSQGEFDCCPSCVPRPDRGCTPVYKQTNLIEFYHEGMECDSLSPVIGSACFGVCASASVMLMSGRENQKCQCCKSNEVRSTSTVLRCKQYSSYYPYEVQYVQKVYNYDVILSCACNGMDTCAQNTGAKTSAFSVDDTSAFSLPEQEPEMSEWVGVMSNVDNFNVA